MPSIVVVKRPLHFISLTTAIAVAGLRVVQMTPTMTARDHWQDESKPFKKEMSGLSASILEERKWQGGKR